MAGLKRVSDAIRKSNRKVKAAKSPDPFMVQIVYAFLDVMDGVKDHDIRGMTGLPDERCDEIAAVRKEAFEMFGKAWLDKFVRDNALVTVQELEARIDKYRREINLHLKSKRSLRKELRNVRDAIKLIIGRDHNIPWPEVPESEVDGFIAEICKLKKGDS